MSQFPNRAALWLNKLAPNAPLMSGLCPSVQVADGQINGENVRFIAVVPDANNHYPRAAGGEVGLLEGWTLAKVVNETIAADADQPVKRPIVAVIDVPSQAYGRREEAFGIHQALAGVADGRRAGVADQRHVLALLQAFEQAVQCRAHLADLVVTTQFDARRQVEFGLDARDGLLHAGQPPANAALERKTETTEEERAEHDRYDRQPVAVGQSGVGLLPL